jgi:hypothetical protein
MSAPPVVWNALLLVLGSPLVSAAWADGPTKDLLEPKSAISFHH